MSSTLFSALMAAFIVGDFAQRSRALRLHADLLGHRLVFYLKLVSWDLWILAGLVSFLAERRKVVQKNPRTRDSA